MLAYLATTYVCQGDNSLASCRAGNLYEYYDCEGIHISTVDMRDWKRCK